MPSSQVEQQDFAAGRFDTNEGEFTFGTHYGSIAFAQRLSIDGNVSLHNLNPGISLRINGMLHAFMNCEFTGVYTSILPDNSHRFLAQVRHCEQSQGSAFFFGRERDLLI